MGFRDKSPAWVYTKSKGFYAGIQLDGTVVTERNGGNERFYGRKINAAELIRGDVMRPSITDELIYVIEMAEGRRSGMMMNPMADAPTGSRSSSAGSRSSPAGSRSHNKFDGHTSPHEYNGRSTNTYPAHTPGPPGPSLNTNYDPPLGRMVMNSAPELPIPHPDPYITLSDQRAPDFPPSQPSQPSHPQMVEKPTQATPVQRSATLQTVASGSSRNDIEYVDNPPPYSEEDGNIQTIEEIEQ